MLQGKVHAALQHLSCHSSGGVLDLDAQVPERSPNGDEVMSTTRKILLDKHPLGKPPDPSTLLTDPPGVVNPIIFDGLDADAISSASLHATGVMYALAVTPLICKLCSTHPTVSQVLPSPIFKIFYNH